MPGYSVRAKEDGSRFLEIELLCVFCHYLLRKARQITACGHLYCEECLEEVINSPQRKCRVPECDSIVSSLDETFEDRATQRDVLKVGVLCYNVHCPWQGTLKELETKHKFECTYNSNTCSNEGCGQTFDDVGQLKEHMINCTNRVMPCKFAYVGCTEMGNKRQLIEHCKDMVCDHINLINTKLLNLEGYSSNKESTEFLQLQSSIRQLTESINRQEANQSSPSIGGARSKTVLSSKRQATESPAKVGKVMEQLDRISGLVQDVKRQVEMRERRITESASEVVVSKERLKEVKLVLSSLETQMSQREQSLNDRSKLIETKEKATYDGVLIWKIDQFNKRQREAQNGQCVSFYSHFFYSSKFGYKMRARIYLNGDGSGRGSHISLFFVICMGDYDAILTWPFSKKVTMMIIDQCGVLNITDAFIPNRTSSSYQRPTTPMNIASGIPDFMELSQLDDPHAGYASDDCLFVKIIVQDP